MVVSRPLEEDSRMREEGTEPDADVGAQDVEEDETDVLRLVEGGRFKLSKE